jgi:hypothetical protein
MPSPQVRLSSSKSSTFFILARDIRKDMSTASDIPVMDTIRTTANSEEHIEERRYIAPNEAEKTPNINRNRVL